MSAEETNDTFDDQEIDVENPSGGEDGRAKKRASSIGSSVIKSLRDMAHLDLGDDAENVFQFHDLKMVIKSGKELITDCHGSIHSGHVMAIMGPSGAGKTTLLRALTLESFAGGQPIGSVTLNGQTMSEKLFRQNCYVVKQQDNPWPYLTCRETLLYAAELFEIVEKPQIPTVVDDIITKMGLDSCSQTKCAALSGGQKRRLSVCVALLKRPTVLFLDEPTSGLDSASASNCMEEIRNIAKNENLIVLCTIHQPATKVFNGFDQVMVMSMGRQAFMGDVSAAQEHFASIGYPMPKNTNPADFYLDLVNADFSSTEEVVSILDAWKEKRTIDKAEGTGDLGNLTVEGRGRKDFMILIRRHLKLIRRDRILYLGRAFVFFVINLFFALVYLKARPFDQAQALNKVWVNIWMVGVPANMGVVAVYALNLECKAIIAEAKNGMVAPASYVVAKSLLVLPIFFIFAICAMSVAGWGVQGFVGSTYGIVMVIWAVNIFCFECAAEAFAILCDDPIMGMLNFMNFWFSAFLFGGIMLPLNSMIWPFKAIYYIMPLSYCMRSLVYALFVDATWEPCVALPNDPNRPAVCVPSTDGEDVLDALGRVYPLFGSDNTVATDIAAMIGIGIFWKLVHSVVVVYKARKVANIKAE